MERKELTATKVINSKVYLQIFEVDGIYDVFVFPDASDLTSVRIKQEGIKEEVIEEAIKQFEEINWVRLT
ncbi:hypothetical protein [Bacillus sp. JJ1562]|uniref:hypothetical protein n=1 Tax=Bacillus sp. JJ1562 TaxID=3122960 RepID=UPI0030028A7D